MLNAGVIRKRKALGLKKAREFRGTSYKLQANAEFARTQILLTAEQQ
jgi:hypothetical protein